MSYVVINVLTVPGGRGDVLEQRFTNRAGMVENSSGFEHFELLRPVEGTDQYLVYTRWKTKEDFDAWQSSQAFQSGHKGASRPTGDGPAATGSSIWAFEVVTEA
ncbi:antibiotic biosynthesis monooxygenase family protein [Kineosporia babensis]|uniref:Antibiotic biosynthesis monooxygenase n=1 Tax=Kineosporia babensis TaxID=499548 RepID=A0A9X1NGR7_9ACTN|nr:antibiotic biosynthesis monooxygenase [Kineosporia babensis]MCD5313219.1 antibiotic biosynthesis monooxygenase [Kineosporia babensis]